MESHDDEIMAGYYFYMYVTIFEPSMKYAKKRGDRVLKLRTADRKRIGFDEYLINKGYYIFLREDEMTDDEKKEVNGFDWNSYIFVRVA